MMHTHLEKAFVRVLSALAELEALNSSDALPGATACVARVELRLQRYLAVSSRAADGRPEVKAEVIRALLGRVKDAVARGVASAVISAGSDLRDEVVAHHRGLAGPSPRTAP